MTTELEEIDKELQGNLLIFRELITKISSIDAFEAMHRCYIVAAYCLVDMWVACGTENNRDLILLDLRNALNMVAKDQKEALEMMDEITANGVKKNVEIN